MDFYKRVACVCKRIPYGNVATYGQIALLCGSPRNSRQVGYALNRGLAGAEAPAHRVVNHQGFLSGAQAFDMPGQQKLLLESEGVRIECQKGCDRTDLKRYGWKHTLEDALELKAEFEQENI